MEVRPMFTEFAVSPLLSKLQHQQPLIAEFVASLLLSKLQHQQPLICRS